MTEQGMISPEAMAWIGHQYAEKKVLVREDDIMRFLHAIREPTDDLKSSGLVDDDGVLVAPPLFYVYLRNLPFQTVALDDLGEDGYVAEELPPLPVTRGMAGEIFVEFGRPIRAGDEVTVRKRLTGLQEKSGRSGPFVVVGFETEMLSASGELLAREQFGRIMR